MRGCNDDEESELFSDDEAESHSPRRKKSQRTENEKQRRSAAAAAVAAVSSSAFPGADVASSSKEQSEASEASEADSQAGSDARFERAIATSKRIFHVRGVSCLGCCLDRDVVGKVDEFVKTNMARLEPAALFRSAAVYWKCAVVEPAACEGSEIPLWPWKDLRNHYILHNVSPDMQRVDSIRSLASCRKLIEQSLVREEEDGTTTLDAKNADLLMKLIAMQSKELQLLTSSTMPPPLSRAPRCP